MSADAGQCHVFEGLGGDATGPYPTDRGKPGGKHHLLTDADGTTLVATVAVANVSDGIMLLPLVDAIPKVRGRVGAPRKRPDSLTSEMAYDSNFREVMPHVKASSRGCPSAERAKGPTMPPRL